MNLQDLKTRINEILTTELPEEISKEELQKIRNQADYYSTQVQILDAQLNMILMQKKIENLSNT